jgi:hypothetical protein
VFSFAVVLEKRSPLCDLKSIKNEVELEGLRQSHLRDGAALVRPEKAISDIRVTFSTLGLSSGTPEWSGDSLLIFLTFHFRLGTSVG